MYKYEIILYWSDEDQAGSTGHVSWDGPYRNPRASA